MLMGAGIAFAAIGSAAAFISKTLAGMSGLAISISIICIILAVLLPMFVLCLVKLRRQDLSALLEGNGWAINARMRLNGKLRRHFSRNGIYPKDAEGTPAKRRCRILLTIIIVAVLLCSIGFGLYFGCRAATKQKAAECAAEPAPLEEVAADCACPENAATEVLAEEAVPSENEAPVAP